MELASVCSIAHLQSNSPAAAAAIRRHDHIHEFKGFVEIRRAKSSWLSTKSDVEVKYGRQIRRPLH